MGANRLDDPKEAGGRHEGSKCVCIVLVQQEATRPDALVNGLASRGSKPLLVRHPVEVMVALASNRRAVVVIDQPEAVANLPQLLGAIRRYYPNIACWGYRAPSHGRPAKLARIDQVRTSSSHDSQVRPGSAKAVQAAADRKVSTPVAPRMDHEQQPGNQDGGLPEPLLTREELSMLIGPHFGEDDETGQMDDHGTELGF